MIQSSWLEGVARRGAKCILPQQRRGGGVRVQRGVRARVDEAFKGEDAPTQKRRGGLLRRRSKEEDDDNDERRGVQRGIGGSREGLCGQCVERLGEEHLPD